MDKGKALELIHHPDKDKVQEYLEFQAPAQKRLIFEELFFIQTLMALRQAGLKKEKTIAIAPARSISKTIKKLFVFSTYFCTDKEFYKKSVKTYKKHNQCIAWYKVMSVVEKQLCL